MRGRQRPGSSHSAASQLRGNAFTTTTARQPARRVFNCIVDDTALVAGVKKSTRNGIRQWVKNGQIRLFVPLHALEQLRRLMDNGSRRGEDIQGTLQWLDEATSKYPNSVTLQGGDETYARWAEVERFAIPRTLFSETYVEHEQVHDDADSALAADADAKLRLSGAPVQATDNSNAFHRSPSVSPSPACSASSNVSPESPPTSPAKAAPSPDQTLVSLTNRSALPESSSSAVVPPQLQGLFNYILWRIHQELDPVAALESFIFLCNDPSKANIAKGFDIKTKRLEQLRDAVSREDRDFRNRQLLLNRENHTNHAVAPLSSQDLADVDNEEEEQQGESDDDDEELVVFRPVTPKAPAAMLQKQTPNLIDPHAFGGRGPQPFASLEQPPVAPKSPRSPPMKHSQAFRGSPRGAHALPFAPRGSGRGNARGGFRGSGRGRGGGAATANNNNNSSNPAAPVGQIDPDSFTRPEPRGGFNGGRGARKLWVPT